jgi:hypothetical protein
VLVEAAPSNYGGENAAVLLLMTATLQRLLLQAVCLVPQ